MAKEIRYFLQSFVTSDVPKRVVYLFKIIQVNK